MLWFYRCPKCGQELSVDWPTRTGAKTCRHCRHSHFAPSPAETVEAYISGHRWPPEMEQAVVAMHGKTCAVPGCYVEYARLAHRRPVAAGGRTSVANLVPLCADHLAAKGERDWNEWLAELAAREQQDVVARLDRPPDLPAPGIPDCSTRFPAGARCHSLAGWTRVPETCPPGMRLLAARPFICGTVRRLVLNYCWRCRGEGCAEVSLIAWPHGRSPDLGRLNNNGTLSTGRRHQGREGDAGTGWLELELPDADGACWVAAVALTDEAGRLELEECMLAGVEAPA